MPLIWLLVLLGLLAAAGFVAGRRRALASAGGDGRGLHSLPVYYGANVVLSALIPSLTLLAVWTLLQPPLLEAWIAPSIPDSAIPPASDRALIMNDVRRIAGGLDALAAQGRPVAAPSDLRAELGRVGVPVIGDIAPPVLAAAE
ncbi:phosphate ABC transporter permease family protein, partial [Oceaniovalibus guishaninsula]|uniref:phosphate ABC transporter permease family protein n=1 Tax=Oceaniovalibus guishaninsula TaxID=1046117 RepID=UPI00058F4713